MLKVIAWHLDQGGQMAVRMSHSKGIGSFATTFDSLFLLIDRYGGYIVRSATCSSSAD